MHLATSQREPGRATVTAPLLRELEKEKWVYRSTFLFLHQQVFIERKKTEICSNPLHDFNVSDVPLKKIKRYFGVAQGSSEVQCGGFSAA